MALGKEAAATNLFDLFAIGFLDRKYFDIKKNPCQSILFCGWLSLIRSIFNDGFDGGGISTSRW